MSWLQRLAEKPWESSGEIPDLHADLAARPAGRTGLYLFLAVVTSFFLLFSVAQRMRMTFGDWQVLDEPDILWLNTIVLIAASGALQWASNAARSQRPGMTPALLLAVGLSLAFMVGQWLAWQQMLSAGLIPPASPSYAFFYLFTGLHALHLLGGLWFLGRASVWALRSPGDSRIAGRLGLCATYWHFLLLVWFVLFYLLLTS